MFFYSKKFFIIIIAILLIILAYIQNINSIPDNIILFNGNELILETMAGIKVKQINSSSKQFISKSKLNKDLVHESSRSKFSK